MQENVILVSARERQKSKHFDSISEWNKFK